MEKLFLTTIIGIVSGLIAGFLGTAHATTMLPALILFKIVPNYTIAAGTTLFTLIPPLSIAGAYVYYKSNQIDYRVGITLIISATIATYFGAKYHGVVSQSTSKKLLAAYFIIIASYLIYDS